MVFLAQAYDHATRQRGSSRSGSFNEQLSADIERKGFSSSIVQVNINDEIIPLSRSFFIFLFLLPPFF
jgi:hypothetical protein